jgi:hypothetical protein
VATTLQDVVNRITLDYLVRTDLDAAVVRSVQAAIRRYERRRWPWNETVTTLTASNGAASLSLPTDFLILDRLEIQFQSSTYALVPESLSVVRDLNAANGSTGLPTRFDQRAYEFELTPIPNSAYLLNCYYLKRLTELSSNDMTASNAWLSAAEDLVVYHATKLIWANVLRNAEEASKYAQLERDAYTELKSYAEQRTATGLRPTNF